MSAHISDQIYNTSIPQGFINLEIVFILGLQPVRILVLVVLLVPPFFVQLVVKYRKDSVNSMGLFKPFWEDKISVNRPKSVEILNRLEPKESILLTTYSDIQLPILEVRMMDGLSLIIGGTIGVLAGWAFSSASAKQRDANRKQFMADKAKELVDQKKGELKSNKDGRLADTLQGYLLYVVGFVSLIMLMIFLFNSLL